MGEFIYPKVIVFNMVYEELESLLTENEKKVYIELLKLGESTAAPILKKTGLQNSVFYRTIHRLMEKGFVSYILKGKIKHFKASSPDLFLSHLKEKEAKIKSIIPNLKSIAKSSETNVEAEVFIGYKGLKSMFYALAENVKSNEKYCYFSINAENFKEAYEKVYFPFRAYREEKNIIAYGIHRKEIKSQIEKFKLNKDKFVDFPLPPNMAIYGDKIAITSWGGIPTGILIKDKDIANQYKELFWEIWKKGK